LYKVASVFYIDVQEYSMRKRLSSIKLCSCTFFIFYASNDCVKGWK
jgi:hypothetical protein